MSDDTYTEGVPTGSAELTLETMQALIRSMKPMPKMPRWKDLTWAQRNMIEREIDATENCVVREAMRANYYRDED